MWGRPMTVIGEETVLNYTTTVSRSVPRARMSGLPNGLRLDWTSQFEIDNGEGIGRWLLSAGQRVAGPHSHEELEPDRVREPNR